MNAASTVVSVVAGRSERLKHRVYEATGLGEVFNDSNVHLSVKSSPDKTTAALSLLAEREGLITKLNDSGSWRRRRALLVPHTFLYYFGEHTAETDLRPHGVIDLELYTDIQVVDGNLLKLAPGDETSPIRTFYLRLKDGDEAEEWAQAIRETRFGVVRDERDALRSAKTGLSDQLVTHEEAIHESLALLRASRGRESAAVSELSRRDAEEARRVEQVRALLAASASSPASCDGGGGGGGSIADNVAEPSEWARSGGERPRSSSSSRCTGGSDSESGGCLRGCVSSSSLPERARSEASCAVVGGMGTGVGGGESSVAATALSELAALEEVIAERAREVASLKMANEALREKEALADDRRRRDVAEALRLRDHERERAEGEASLRSDLETELQRLREELADSRAGREEARVNLGVVAAACREAEAKSRELQEHRRVLAREVKASRTEQRRLSAALNCATTAAAAAAATAAAAKAETAAANTAAAAAAAAAASSGNRDRSSSAASSAAEDERGEVSRRGKQEEGTGCVDGENGHDFEGSSGGEAMTLPAPEGQLGEERGVPQAAVEMAAETPDGGGSVHSGVDGGSGRVAPGNPEAAEETLSDSAMAQTAPVVWVRPSSLDVAGVSSRRQEGGQESSTGGSESGATSPEEGSPVFPGTGACEGGGDGGGVSGGSGEGESRSRPDDSGFRGDPTAGEEGPSRGGNGCFAASRSPSPPAAGGGVGFGEKGDEELEAETCADGGMKDGGDKKGEQGEEGARARSSSPPPPSTRGGNNPPGPGVESGGGGGGGGDRSSSPAATAAATAEALAAAFGESSSLRLNQMVASLSAGIRETRKARRKPLLGHLDDDDEGDDCGGGGGLNAGPPPVSADEEDDGGVTDGTGTDGGDSRHDPATTVTTTTRKNSGGGGGGNGAWSAWSTVGGGGAGGGGTGGGNSSHHGPPPLLFASDEERRRSCGVSSTTTMSMTAAGGGSTDDGGDERCGRDAPEVFVGAFAGEPAPKTSPGAVAAAAAAGSEEQGIGAPPHGPCSSTEVASTSTALDAADDTASKQAASLLRSLDRPDGEGGEGKDAQQGPQIQGEDESTPSSLALTQRRKSGGGGGIDEDGGSSATTSGSAGAVAVVGQNTHGGAGVGVGDGSVGEAAVAVALAAAERGGRLSAEAADAARRWEAKLKGSFVSMAGGVRWGMASQRPNDVKFFKP